MLLFLQPVKRRLNLEAETATEHENNEILKRHSQLLKNRKRIETSESEIDETDTEINSSRAANKRHKKNEKHIIPDSDSEGDIFKQCFKTNQ